MRAPRWLVFLWFFLILTAWAVRGLPWNLEEYDQAKQAYTSYEMIDKGHWWYQHTPRQNAATKPPLMGWMSAGLFAATGWWDFAWRLPSFAAAVGILILLWKSGQRVAGEIGGFVATGAFAWNLLSLRLATMVRTDMLLAFLIFAGGWLMWRRLQQEEKWTWKDTAWLTLLLGAAAMTKGPIYHAFLLPALIVWALLARENSQRGRILRHYALASVVSAIPFLIWTWLRIRQDPSFYDQVVVKEFLGRFTTGEEAVHNNQTWYFYLPHLLAKCAPWSLVALAACFFQSVRDRIVENRATLWLTCWLVGGLVVMSIVPSKRVDRIFPVVPVAALWLAAIWSALPPWKLSSRQFATVCCVVAVLSFGGYTIAMVTNGYRENVAALPEFGRKVRELATAKNLTLAVAEGRDEGLLMYLDQPKFSKPRDVLKDLRSGKIDAAVVDDKALLAIAKNGNPPVDQILTARHPTKKGYAYHLIRLSSD